MIALTPAIGLTPGPKITMPFRALLSIQAYVATKALLFSWIVAGLSTFGLVENQSHDVTYAAKWAAISALGAALIAATCKVCITTINTSRSRREQREIERSNDFSRLHAIYTEAARLAAERLQDETNILRVVRNAKHQLVSDIGARDHYIDSLHDILLSNGIKFSRMRFRNIAEAFQEEDRQVNAIVGKTITHELGKQQ